MIFCSVVMFPASPAAEKKQKQGLNMTAEKKAQQDKVAKRKITRLPASPAAEKKQKQQLKMTAEKKKAQQDKIFLIMKITFQAEGIDAVAKCKKTNREYKKRCCKAETIVKSAKCKITNREYMKRCCKAESIDIAATRKKIIRENMKRQCMAESHDTAATQRCNNNTSKKRKRHGWQHDVSTVCHWEEMTNAIKRSMKKAKQILHRTQEPANPHCHRAIVHIICDRFIIGTETIRKLTNDQISKHSKRLSVQRG